MNGRRMIAAGIVAGAVAVGGVAGALIGIPGISGATGSSDSTSSTTTPQSDEAPYGGHHFRGFFGPKVGADKGVLDAAAKALNLSTEDLLEKLSDGKTTIADVAEQQNVDVQTVIDAMVAVAKEDIENLVNNPLPAPPHGFPDGPKLGGRGFGFAFGLPGLREGLDPIAKALGMTTDELRTELRNGKSIADIAKAKNVDLDTIADALVKEAQTRFDQAVKDGKLSQEQADEIQAKLKEHITALLNGELPFGLGRGGFRIHGGPGRWGPDGPPLDLPDEANPSSAAA